MNSAETLFSWIISFCPANLIGWRLLGLHKDPREPYDTKLLYDMIVVLVGTEFRFLAVASPGYLQGKPIPDKPDQLAMPQFIKHRLPSGKRYRWEFQQHGQEVVVDVSGAMTLASSQLMVSAMIEQRPGVLGNCQRAGDVLFGKGPTAHCLRRPTTS